MNSLKKPASLTPFSINQKHFRMPNYPNPSVTFIRYVEINVYGKQFRLLKATNYASPFTINGIAYTIPYTDPVLSINIVVSGGWMVFSTGFGLTVNWLNDDNPQLHSILCDAYSNYVCGLCGNYDGKQSIKYQN